LKHPIDMTQLASAMRDCVGLARNAVSSGNYPIGAVVLGENGIISRASSELIESFDPSAHPEMIAIRSAAATMRSRYLPSTFLVTTLEPCPMCTAAAIWAKMEGIAFAATQEDAVAIGKRLASPLFTFRQIAIHCKDVVDAGTPVLSVFPELLRSDVIDLFDEFVTTKKGEQ
jgi:tRNA(Arg) A34 adenosine deaminase TadA